MCNIHNIESWNIFEAAANKEEEIGAGAISDVDETKPWFHHDSEQWHQNHTSPSSPVSHNQLLGAWTLSGRLSLTVSDSTSLLFDVCQKAMGYRPLEDAWIERDRARNSEPNCAEDSGWSRDT